MIANMREAFHERAMFNVIREVDFSLPSDPESVGFKALYQTELGNRYVWALRTKGKMIRVIVTVFAPTNFAVLIGEVEEKVFGLSRP